MTNIEKLTARFLQDPTSMRMLEIEKILFKLNFEKKQGKGSHVIYWHKELVRPIVFAIHQKNCKNYQKREALKILRELNLL